MNKVNTQKRLSKWLHAAFESHGKGREREAEKYARRVLDALPDQPDALHLLATLAREKGRQSLAIERYRRLLARHPAIPIAHNNLGNLLQERADYSGAIECYRQALAFDADYVSAWMNLGHALVFVGNLPQARECLEKALRLAPDDPEINAKLSAVMIETENSTNALSLAEKAVEIAPDSADYWTNLGSLRSTIGEFEKAHACYRRALSLDPGFAKAALALTKARRFGNKGDDDEDISKVKRAASLGLDDPKKARDLHLALGKIHDDRGEWEEAFSHFEKANASRAEAARKGVESSLALMKRIRKTFTPSWLQRQSQHRESSNLGSGLFGAGGREDPIPVFIVGMPRSGTSLVEQLLCAHPEVYGAGELREIDQLAWGDSAAQGEGGLGYPERFADIDPEKCLTMGRGYLDFLRTRSSDAQRITDKLPGNYLHLGLIAAILPKARIIYCRRHPEDIAISVYFTDFWVGHEYSYDLAAIGHHIKGMYSLMDHWQAMIGERILSVDYEDLVQDPEPSVRAMLDHIDLPWDDACLRPHEVKRSVRTASVWQVRQPIYGHSSGRARHYHRFLGSMREALGLDGRGDRDPSDT
ncbi:tetratricopeptide repeat-containing sulfotransferase family protein [Thioalkalivibrio sp. HK1]|uniref:tetratricopeptide repeat-containing sulfotransferase family protein n=1 Tax=Thioalkalivibrio sp. HK1 TaxID=1469245 RepID=UPI0004AD2FE5|nr:tetratricopeptide repeat-containing sulfotransferase family protein [Thioalkalivibrio sp. HK1]